jgi:hypothetical protein
MMEATETWRSLFENWPDAIPTKGTVVTVHGDAIKFANFMISGSLLLIEQDKPDAMGNRKVMLPYEFIASVKLASAGELSQFQCMGFQSPL